MPYWHAEGASPDRVYLHYWGTNSFVLSFDANNQELTNFFPTKQRRV